MTNIDELPTKVLGNIMRYLNLHDRISILTIRGSASAFNIHRHAAFLELYPLEMIVCKLMEYMDHDSEFIQRIFSMLGNARLSHIINNEADWERWWRVEFMLKNGVDPNLLTYSLYKIKLRGRKDDLDQLLELVGDGLDVSYLLEKWNSLQKEMRGRRYPFERNWPSPPSNRAEYFDRLLHSACCNGQTELAVSLLMEIGAYPNTHVQQFDHYDEDDEREYYASDIALRYGQYDIVKAMLLCGIHVSLVDAVRYGHMDIVKLLGKT